MESSQTRDRACVPGIDKWILNHWTTREVQNFFFFCNEQIIILKNKHTMRLFSRRRGPGGLHSSPPPFSTFLSQEDVVQDGYGQRKSGRKSPRQLKARISGPADFLILCFQPQIPRLLTSQHLLLTCQMPLNLQIKPLITEFFLM